MPAAKDSGSGVTTRAQDKGNDEQAALNHVRGKSPQLSLKAMLMIRTHRNKENKGNFARKCPYPMSIVHTLKHVQITDS